MMKVNNECVPQPGSKVAWHAGASRMKRTLTLVLLACVASVAAFWPTPSVRAASVLWQTTFNCGDWNQNMGLAANQVNCDSMTGEANWGNTLGTSGVGSQITSLANNSIGAGGKGFRFWRADGFDVNSSGIWANLPSGQTDLWIRFYVRYQQGFSWANGGPGFTKDIYMLGNTATDFKLGFQGQDTWGVTVIGPANNFVASPGWNSLFGANASDGLWHCYETHTKLDTNHANGVIETWIDGIQRISRANIDFNTVGSWQHFVLGENSNRPSNGKDMYEDYDDVAVSNSGRIGCLAGQAPAAPTNLRVVP